MKCPKCSADSTRVYDSRLTQNGRAVRRRRVCSQCNYRFTTVEEVKILDLYVEKRNGQVVPFEIEKIEQGIKKSFNKRKIDTFKISRLVQKVVEDIVALGRNPVKSTRIGKIVLKNLREYDEAAYICYWAMYGSFNTAEDFNKLLKEFNTE